MHTNTLMSEVKVNDNSYLTVNTLSLHYAEFIGVEQKNNSSLYSEMKRISKLNSQHEKFSIYHVEKKQKVRPRTGHEGPEGE